MTTLTPEQVALYLDDLRDLSEDQLVHAFRIAKRSWKPEYGRTFPSIAELREFAMEWRPPENVKIPDCPAVMKVREALKKKELIDYPWLNRPATSPEKGDQ